MFTKYMHVLVAVNLVCCYCIADCNWSIFPFPFQFNRKPARGIEYLLLNKLIENNATSVAHFLKSNSSLDKVIQET
jgi:hypothetical protein